MKQLLTTSSVALAYVLIVLSSCSTQDEMPAKRAASAPASKAAGVEKAAPAAKTTAKAKVEKARGDVGLLDTEKNYLILVTKEGKLITLDFDEKTKATQIKPTPSKVGEIGLGSSATVTYTTKGDKNVASSLEYRPAKGGE